MSTVQSGAVGFTYILRVTLARDVGGVLKLQYADSGERIGQVCTTLPRETEKHGEIRKLCPTEGVTSGTVKPTY